MCSIDTRDQWFGNDGSMKCKDIKRQCHKVSITMAKEGARDEYTVKRGQIFMGKTNKNAGSKAKRGGTNYEHKNTQARLESLDLIARACVVCCVLCVVCCVLCVVCVCVCVCERERERRDTR